MSPKITLPLPRHHMVLAPVQYLILCELTRSPNATNYSFAIAQAIAKRLNVTITIQQIGVSLRRLRNRRFVSSKSHLPSKNKKMVAMYTIEPDGRKALHCAAMYYKALADAAPTI